MSFDTSAFSEYMSALDRASLAKVVGHVSPSEVPGLSQTDLNDLIVKYKIPQDLHPRLPAPDFVMSKLPNDVIGIYYKGYPHYMSWRHSKLAISDPKPPVGSYSQADVRRLSAHVVKLWGMPKEVLVLFSLSRVWKSRTRDPILRKSSRNGIYDFLCLLEWTGSEVHDVRVAKTSHAILQSPRLLLLNPLLSHTCDDLCFSMLSPFAMSLSLFLSSSPLAREIDFKNLVTGDLASSLISTFLGALLVSEDEESEDADDNACYEIPINTPVRSAATIPTGRNQGGGVVSFVVEGKAIMDDAVDTSTRCAGRSQAFTGPIPVYRDPTCDAIDRVFFSFAPGPYYATHPKDDIAVSSYEVTARSRMVHTSPLLLPWPRRFSRILKFVSGLKKQVANLNDKVTASDPAFVKAKANEKEQNKKIKSLSKTIDQFTAKAFRLASDLNQSQRSDAQKGDQIATAQGYLVDVCALIDGGFHSLVQKFLARDEFRRVQGELLSLAASVGFERRVKMDRTLEKLDATLKKIYRYVPGAQAHPEVVLALKTTHVSPPLTMESVVTLVSSSLGLPSNDAPSYAAVLVEQPSSEKSEEGGARGMPENNACCSELRGIPTVDV
uniref:Uncharacterized protein n=1 Tax=Tanacetum cinerariifolium TaxID=118510 RepID=A0A699GV86_TANCI|nr:hypothetical protein [Tanacetum cinerariifolium]